MVYKYYMIIINHFTNCTECLKNIIKQILIDDDSLISIKSPCIICAIDKFSGKYGPGYSNSKYIIYYDQIDSTKEVLKNLKNWIKYNSGEIINVIPRGDQESEPCRKKTKLCR